MVSTARSVNQKKLACQLASRRLNVDEHMNRSIGQREFRKVIESVDLSLVQFKAEWNGACQLASLIFEDLAKTYGDSARFYNVDIDEPTGLDSEYGVNEIPTILFFKRGHIIDYARGLTSKKELIAKIENALAN
jgi:thioredoxin 1